MKGSRLLLFIAILGCILLVWTLPAMAAKTIKIGIIGPMQFAHGKQHWNGATMAVEKINALIAAQRNDGSLEADTSWVQPQLIVRTSSLKTIPYEAQRTR